MSLDGSILLTRMGVLFLSSAWEAQLQGDLCFLRGNHGGGGKRLALLAVDQRKQRAWDFPSLLAVSACVCVRGTVCDRCECVHTHTYISQQSAESTGELCKTGRLSASWGIAWDDEGIGWW